MNAFQQTISGGISGAISDPMSDDAVAHAYKRYGMIRGSHTDIDRIVENTGFTKSQVILVKNYLFMDVHELEGGYRRFDPDFAIGESWWRMAFDAENIHEHDLLLIKHELYEMQLIAQVYSQQDAHNKAELDGYNYQKASNDYYNVSNAVSTHGIMNSGATIREEAEYDADGIRNEESVNFTENIDDEEDWDIEL